MSDSLDVEMSDILDGGIFLIKEDSSSKWHDANSDELKKLEIKYLIDEYNYLLATDKSDIEGLYQRRKNLADQGTIEWKDTSQQGIAKRSFTTPKHSIKATLNFETFKTIRGW